MLDKIGRHETDDVDPVVHVDNVGDQCARGDGLSLDDKEPPKSAVDGRRQRILFHLFFENIEFLVARDLLELGRL